MKYLFLISVLTIVQTVNASDSLRTEILNGKKVIVYKIEQGNTLFSIAKRYNVTVSEIKSINPSLNQIKTGSELYIPVADYNTNTEGSASVPDQKKRGTDEGQEHILHKVMQGETLYKISKMYNVTVSQITEANQLGAKGAKQGQELIIPQGPHQNSVNIQTTKENNQRTLNQPVKTEKRTSLTGYPSITESGAARLDESLPQDSYQVLHKSAKTGTLIMLKNKETGTIAHAKVTGSTGSQELVVINKKVFTKLEGKSSTLLVDIYYTPED